MKKNKKLLSLLVFTAFLLNAFSKTIYVAPNGTGNGNSESSPLGNFSIAVERLEPGDTMLLADGEYKQTLQLSRVYGTFLEPITIMAKNVCGAFINGDSARTHAVYIYNCDYIILDGIKAGNTKHGVYRIDNCNNVVISRCAGFNAGYYVARDGGVVQDTYEDNCHIFGIAYSNDILAEDVWAWGTGRYCFVYFQSKNCILRRGVFRPTDPELGYGYDRCPHSGFNLYDCDNSIAENCIAFETRVHPQSTHNADNIWGLVQGGMVFDDHTIPSGFNHVYGCFDLDNGQYRTEVARSNSAVHLMSKWSGEFEDIVIWKNAHDYQFVKSSTATVVFPTRSLIGSPTRVRNNTIVDSNMNRRYMNGELTDIPLWPWPYEDIIKEQMGMEETMTEYVTRMVEGFLTIDPVTPISVIGLSFNKDSVIIDDGATEQLFASVMPDTASNDYLYWVASDQNIVQVNKDGLITGINPGHAYVIVRTDDGGFRDTCFIEVKAISVSGIMLDQDSISVNINEEEQLTLTVNPENASNRNATWQSANVQIAVVSSSGFVKGKKEGSVNIVVTSEDGGYKDTCYVRVNLINVAGVTLDYDSVSLEIGKLLQFTETVIPENASNKFVSWESLDSDIVKSYGNGLFSGLSGGTTKVVVASNDGGFTDTCIVYVHPKAVAATGISLDDDSITLDIDGTYKLTTQLEPSNTTDTTVFWNSSDTTIASVSNQGLVIGVSYGMAEIVASTSNGLRDTCLVTVSELSGENPRTNSRVSVYPNPAGSDFVIDIGENAKAIIKIVDITGSTTFEKILNDQKLTIPEGTLKTGLYFVRIQINKSVSLMKLIIL